MENVKILVVEDDWEVANIIKNILHNTGFNMPVVVSNGEAAISATKIIKPDLILMDIKLEGDIDGIEAAKKIKKSHDIPIIFLTANSENDILKMASKTNPLAFIIKPFKAKDLIANVKNALLQRERSINIKRESIQINEELRNLLNNSASYIYTLEAKDKIHFDIKHSSGCAYVTGYFIEEFNFDPNLYYEIVFKDDKQIFLENINKMLCNDFVEPFEYRIVRKDGSVRWVRNIPIPRHNAEGDIFSYDGLIEDITEKKVSEEFIKNILEAVDEGFVVIDKNYKIISANKAFGNQIKIKPEIVLGKKCYEVFHKLSMPCHEVGISCGVNHVFNTGTSEYF